MDCRSRIKVAAVGVIAASDNVRATLAAADCEVVVTAEPMEYHLRDAPLDAPTCFHEKPPRRSGQKQRSGPWLKR